MNKTLTTLRSSLFLALSLAVLPVGAAGPPPLPGGAPIDDFEICDDRVLELDGRPVDAEVYYSRYEVAYYVASPELSRPLLLSPRGRSVQAVEEANTLRRGRGLHARLGRQAAAEWLGKYRETVDGYVFEVDGRPARLRKRPPAVGGHSAADLGKRHRRYGHLVRERAARRGAEPLVVTGREPLIVRVYFGSWSAACERDPPW